MIMEAYRMSPIYSTIFGITLAILPDPKTTVDIV